MLSFGWNRSKVAILQKRERMNFTFNAKDFFVYGACISVLFSNLQNSTLAQSKSAPLQRKNQDEFKPRILPKAPSLPNIPDYPGPKALKTSFEYPKASGGPSVTVVYNVNEKPSTVLAWYTSQLPSAGWHLNESELTNSIDGQNETGDYVKVTVTGAPTAKSTTLMILYRSQRSHAGL